MKAKVVNIIRKGIYGITFLLKALMILCAVLAVVGIVVGAILSKVVSSGLIGITIVSAVGGVVLVIVFSSIRSNFEIVEFLLIIATVSYASESGPPSQEGIVKKLGEKRGRELWTVISRGDFRQMMVRTIEIAENFIISAAATVLFVLPSEITLCGVAYVVQAFTVSVTEAGQVAFLVFGIFFLIIGVIGLLVACCIYWYIKRELKAFAADCFAHIDIGLEQISRGN